jgi:hypothetical protein
MLVGMGRFLAWTAVGLIGLFVAGWLAIKIFSALIGLTFYLIVGALVVGGGAYLYYRAKRAIGPGSRARRRIEAAGRTYRMRNR